MITAFLIMAAIAIAFVLASGEYSQPLLARLVNLRDRADAPPEGVRSSTALVLGDFSMTDSPEYTSGKVFVDGEIWNARCPAGIKAPRKGDEVRISQVEGLVLIVVPEGKSLTVTR